MTLADCRTLNALLNGGNAVLISLGWLLIRHERKLTHAMCMCVATVISLVLPVYYIIEQAPSGWGHFAGGGIVKSLYFAMATSHRILAFAVVPLVFATMIAAFRAYWEIHRRLSKLTTPLWLYVSVTGVFVNL